MAYPEFNVDGRAFIFPTTTPVQFEPDAMRASIARLMAAAAAPDVPHALQPHRRRADCATRLLAMIDATVAAALAHRDAPDRLQAITAALMALYGNGARAFGVALPDERIAELLLDDAALNAAGLLAWLDRPFPRAERLGIGLRRTRRFGVGRAPRRIVTRCPGRLRRVRLPPRFHETLP